MSKLWKKFVRDEEAATMVEYGIMVALIAVVCIAVVGFLGGQVSSTFQAVVSAL